MTTNSTEFPLPALQGCSLLGFMAALGLFRTLSEQSEMADIHLNWMPEGASYCPVIRFGAPVDIAAMLETLHTALRAHAGHYVINVEKDLKISSNIFRDLAKRAANDFLGHKDDIATGMTAAFGCDSVCNDEGLIEDTAFRTMSGAGHQHFLEFMNVLARETTVEQLREAIFGPWRYRDPSPVMRWDSEDDRRYALRWDEPSKDPVRTVRGANLLAVAALPLFPTVPVTSNVIATTGFSGKGSRNTFLTWPIWRGWLSLDAARSVISLEELQKSNIRIGDLAPRGICAIFRCQRITLGKYRNFTPTQSL